MYELKNTTLLSFIEENIDLKNFRDFVNKTFFNESRASNFAITDLTFNTNEINPQLQITIEHYNSDSFEMKFIFCDLVSFLVINESYYGYINFKPIYSFSFLEIAQGYNINPDLLEMFSNPDQFFTFRITCQNFMVDVFTNNFPKIEIKD